jgi:hypothetical protein
MVSIFRGFSPEDGETVVLQNIVIYLQVYTVLQSRRTNRWQIVKKVASCEIVDKC